MTEATRSHGLPEYRVRVSDRARHVRLTVTPKEGLVVVVPRRWRGNADEVVASRLAWATEALDTVAEARAVHAAGPQAMLPRVIDLRMSGRTLPVEYRGGATRAIARTSGAGVVVGGTDATARLAALSRWLDREARELLPSRTAELAAVHGLSPAHIRVMRARTRWGSCSARGTVALNRAVVFLPSHLADALILHELAHLRVLNHSAGFWRVLETLDPDARRHREEMRRAMRLVPPWAEV